MGYNCVIWDSQQRSLVGPELVEIAAGSAVSRPSLQGWDITWKELPVFAVEESIRADLPAGFDLPCVVQAERVCACAQQEPLQELFARLTQLLGTKPTTLPLPSHAQTNRAAPRKELPRSDPETFPTWTGTSRGTGSSGAARAEGAQPCPVTGCRWDLGLLWGQRWGSQHQDPIPCQGPHRMGMSQHGTPRSSNGHPKPCTSVPLPKEAETPQEKWFR